jgi:hypothetical protein
MDKKSAKNLRLSGYWGAVATIVTALIAGKDAIVKAAIVPLCVIGAIMLILAFWEQGWLRAPVPVGTPIRASVLVILAFGIMALLGWFVVPTVSSEQAEELKNLESFITVKNEAELRQSFDFETMLTLNVGIATNKMLYFRNTGKKDFDLGPYVGSNRDVLLDTQIAGSDLRKLGGGQQYSPAPYAMAFIVETEKYLASKRTLQMFEKSSVLPSDITATVKDFDDLAAKDAHLLILVLDDTLRSHPEYLLGYNDLASPHWHEIDKLYFDRFAYLAPTADKIRDAIRRFRGRSVLSRFRAFLVSKILYCHEKKSSLLSS